MPWLNEQRGRNWKIVQNDADPNRYRVSASLAKLHYESVPGSGTYDEQVNLSATRVDTLDLDGWQIATNSWHFEYQGFVRRARQEPTGTVSYGGRNGEHWLRMLPSRIGFLHWSTETFDAVDANADFSNPIENTSQRSIGINDADPATWAINHEFDVTVGSVFQVGVGVVDWRIYARPEKLKQDFIFEQAARDAIDLYFDTNILTPQNENWFGIEYEIDFDDIPRVTNNRIPIGVDVEPTIELRIENAIGDVLGRFQNGEMFVRGRGGTVTIRKRLRRRGNQWYLFIGARVDEMRQNLLPGVMVLDPPITEQDIVANGDDTHQGSSGATNISGYAGGGYLYNGSYSDYHCGFRFQTVPIAQGATVNSATFEPFRTGYNSGTANVSLYGEDIDDSPIFDGSNNDVTDRTRTTAVTTFTSGDLPASGNRASITVTSIVQEIVNRASWASNNDMTFLSITTSSANTWIGWADYSGGATNAADFNADVSTGGGGGRIMSSLARHGGLAGSGGIAGPNGGLAG